MTIAPPAREEGRAPAEAPAAPPAGPTGGWARWLVGAAAAGFIGLYVVLALMRLRSPVELEWMEGGVVDHVRRVMAGHQLYQRPTLHFIPYIYTPLYYYVAAAASWVGGGAGYVPLRIVSILSSLAAFAAVAALVVTETRDRWAGLVAAGLFAACYRIGGSWFDVARVDSLFLALLFTALWMARRSRTTGAAAATTAVMTLSFLTKQTALLPALSLVPVYLWRGRRPALAYCGGLALGIGGSTVLLNGLSGGWYDRYIFGLPSGHQLVPGKYVGFWTQDLWPLALALVLALAGLIVGHRRAGDDRPPLGFHPLVLAGLVASAYSSRLHSGGFDNVLLPAYGGIAVLFGIGLHHLIGGRTAAPAPAATRGRRRATLLTAAVVAVVGVQLVQLVYDPSAALPPASAARGQRRLVADLRALHGPVYLPGHGWYLQQAGHCTWAQGAAIEDVLRGKDGPMRRTLARQLHDAIVQRRFAAIVVEAPARYSYLPSDVLRYYRRDRHLGLRRALREATGTVSVPDVVLLPLVPRPAPSRVVDQPDCRLDDGH